MKATGDLSSHTNVLPYASEIFGVYQPMIGWRSKRIGERMERGFANDRMSISRAVLAKFEGIYELDAGRGGSATRVVDLGPGRLATSRTRGADTFVAEAIARDLPPLEEYDDSVWDRIDATRLRAVLNDVAVPRVTEWATAQPPLNPRDRKASTAELMAEQLNRESVHAGYLLHLKDTGQFETLKAIFYKPDLTLPKLQALLKFKSPLDYIDPFKDLDRAALSPIGIVHLFRQYFFELDTFLGSPVGHVWMSPGSTVELIEVTTRRTLVERTLETELETILRTEKSTTDEDELSDAVKQDNKSDTKFGMNATANQSWIGGSASASTSIDLNNTQGKAREQTHRHMRQQTEKLSTEIRKNVKSTFRTVTETSDTSSKRYVLSNTTQELINYELRRKMRQVGVQVQDIGSYLCWQAYVDDPGRQLGIAKLVHLAKDPDVGATPPPEGIVMPEPTVTELQITIPFVPKTEDTIPEDDMDEAYRYGKEVNLDTNEGDRERIKYEFGGYRMDCETPGYEFQSLDFDYGGNDIDIRVVDRDEPVPGTVTFGIELAHVNFRNSSPLLVTAKAKWQPTKAMRDEVTAQHQAKVDQFNEATNREFKKAFVDAARDRIDKASRIEPRPFHDLREEERIVVYRSLVQDMLTKGLPMPDDRTRHVVSELLNTIFDVDKMLYFVAPEWWRPRMHRSHQVLGGVREPAGDAGDTGGGGRGELRKRSVFRQVATASTNALSSSAVKGMLAEKEDTAIGDLDVVAWGGTGQNRVDNYYITEESEPAKLGSSLGWLLQLDGDNMRNAFLNAPWVKAVMPIRPGQERAATNWLQRLHVEGTDGLDDRYVAPAAELAEIPHEGAFVTIRDAIQHLCDKVAAKHAAGQVVGRYPGDEINDDNRVSSTPIDKVYEHGFYPLEGGFRVKPEGEDFEIFDQWVEVLPTDQVVPVEVAYDPKTGRQL
jgi:hypothetical protein